MSIRTKNYEVSEILSTFLLNKSGFVLLSSHQEEDLNYKEEENGKQLNTILLSKYEMPKWVIENNQLGFLGEKIALLFLETQYQNVYWDSRQSSLYGYDIRACDYFFEVKTSHLKVSFEITAHELLTAQRYKENYWLFFIYIDEKVKNVEGYLFQNPLNIFYLDPDILCKSVENNEVICSPDRFCVRIEEKIKNIDKVDLTNIYKSLVEI